MNYEVQLLLVRKKIGSEPCQPIPADSTVAKFKTVSTCKSFQTEMTAVPTEISTENGPKKKVNPVQ